MNNELDFDVAPTAALLVIIFVVLPGVLLSLVFGHWEVALGVLTTNALMMIVTPCWKVVDHRDGRS